MKSKPRLHDDLIMDFEAFIELDKRRSEFGAIPFAEIRAYMELNGIDDYKDKQLFIKRIEILDNAYLKWRIEKNKKNGNSRT